MTLKKAQLKANPSDKNKDIIFMFNPKELAFSAMVQTTDNPGARSTRSGRPRVSFNNLSARQLTIKEIWFDTYESGQDVIKNHLQAFIDAVKFDQEKNIERPPTYSFIWGDKIYFDYCFIEQVSYRLTKFLPNGKPVRAVIDSLVLKETEKPSDDASTQKKPKSRSSDNRKSRS